MEHQVPKLSILTFVENAIKHGLRHKEKNRWLKIKACYADGGIRVTIRDNGVGRVAAARLTDGESGNGLELMEHYFRQFSEANGKRARYEVKDLFGQNLKAAGTVVEITIT
jgi:sensor histidine kinase YesM